MEEISNQFKMSTASSQGLLPLDFPGRAEIADKEKTPIPETVPEYSEENLPEALDELIASSHEILEKKKEFTQKSSELLRSTEEDLYESESEKALSRTQDSLNVVAPDSDPENMVEERAATESEMDMAASIPVPESDSGSLESIESENIDKSTEESHAVEEFDEPENIDDDSENIDEFDKSENIEDSGKIAEFKEENSDAGIEQDEVKASSNSMQRESSIGSRNEFQSKEDLEESEGNDELVHQNEEETKSIPDENNEQSIEEDEIEEQNDEVTKVEQSQHDLDSAYDTEKDNTEDDAEDEKEPNYITKASGELISSMSSEIKLQNSSRTHSFKLVSTEEVYLGSKK